MSRIKPVLIVIDVQNGFITEHSESVLPVIVDLVRRWRAADGDVVFTRYLNFVGSPFERLMGWTKMTGGPQINLVAELAPFVGPHTSVVDKYSYTLFTHECTQLIDEQGWTDLYICGIDTESCVLKTAVDAFERDLTPRVIEDACASHSGFEMHNAGLLVIRKFIGIGQVIRAADIPPWVPRAPLSDT